jgi:hypothetical protein
MGDREYPLRAIGEDGETDERSPPRRMRSGSATG